MLSKSKCSVLVILLLLFFSSIKVTGQISSAREEARVIKTYPFSDPNPVPPMGINDKVARFYPYYVFDGYTDKSIDKEWKIVELDNPYIKVLVLPEIGGKVMGAIEKSTGKEFVYLNHVMKFRAIGIRGPWTSGGIEHNFGLDLGHAPWAAAPVDYVVKENEDGSASCMVGGIDLASRTQWRVNIHLPKDKAYFETQSMWYNPTPLHHAYLSWENAAYKATNDLQFFFPGTHHIGHDGSAHHWPIDKEGRDLSVYKENAFGGHKSYHVMGKNTDWFGGYWHNSDFGFGHWAPYSDAPGKKIWIWSLARDGAIWTDLLTDTDGQYIEAQSGVKFNQAAGNSGFHSPFNQLALGPFYSETKTEYWFPVKETKGMVDASPEGTLNVTVLKDQLEISVSPNSAISDSLVVILNGKVVYAENLHLQPMQVYKKTIPLHNIEAKGLKVRVGKDKLVYTDNGENEIDRPVRSPEGPDYNSAEHLFRMAEDMDAMRDYKKALHFYRECIKKEPTHSLALTRIAELHFRSARYEEGLAFARKVLEMNTYDPGANYIYGIIQEKLGRLEKAEEALSVAARSMAYRSGAYTQIAGVNMQKQNFSNAKIYAQKALDYNRNNLMAYELLGTSYRKFGNLAQAGKLFNELLEIDPLNHYAHFERYLLEPLPENLNRFNAGIRNELPHETYLELALAYANRGLRNEAVKVLEQSPAYPTVYYWLAYLTKNSSSKKSREYLIQAMDMSPDFVFPFRLETIPVLKWAQQEYPSWKNQYYLGLIYWNLLELEKAQDLLEDCGDTPDYGPFYISRGILFQDDANKSSYAGINFEKAVTLNPQEWRGWHFMSKYYKAKGSYEQEHNNAKKAYKVFAENPVIGMDYAKALLNVGDYAKTLQVLKKIHILPQEGAREGHDIYELANLAVAINKIEKQQYRQALTYLKDAKKWPENLGAGKPFDPDTRLQDYMAAYCEAQLGNQEQADEYYVNIQDYSLNPDHWSSRNPLNNYFGILTLQKNGKQKEAARLINAWEAEQDSLRDWSIGRGSASPEIQWVLAKYRDDNEVAEINEKKIIGEGNLNRNFIFFRAIKLAGITDEIKVLE